MNGKIAQVTIVVHDQTASLEFYTQKAGFEKRTDVTPPGASRWVTVGLPGEDLELALFQLGSKTVPPDAGKNWKPGASGGIQIRVADCRAAFAELSAKGLKFRESQPVEYPWGVIATFSDPDGNNFALVQPPAWPAKT
ncbi:MAG: VOC family protein [Thermoplasmata archaeon]|nr:VOC family protein [Thermoplasmata archaeon]